MSDIKKWGSDDEPKSTDTSMGKITYSGPALAVDDCKVNFDGVISTVAMFKAAPDLCKALEEMCDMWTTVCDAQGWEPEHVVQYRNAMDSLAKARGECHE